MSATTTRPAATPAPVEQSPVQETEASEDILALEDDALESTSAPATADASAEAAEDSTETTRTPGQADPVNLTAEEEEALAPELRLRDVVFNVSAALGAAINGTDDGQPFAIGQFGALGDYTHFNLAGSALWRAGDWFRVGPELTFDHYRGGNLVYGSHLNSIGVGAVAELNLSHLYGNDTVTFFPRFRVDARVGVGFGTTTSEQALLEARLGPSLGFGLGIDAININFEGISVSAGVYAGTQVVYDIGDSNHAFANIGGMLTVRSSDVDRHPYEIVNRECSMSLEEDLRADVQELSGLNAEIRADNEELQAFLYDLEVQLEARNITSADIVRDMRNAYAQWLQDRPDGAIADADEALAQATERYPDDFNPFELYADPVPVVTLPETLPDNCEELYDLQSQLQEERAALSVNKGFLEGATRAALIRLGVPPGTEQELVRVVTRLREIHFITSRPFDNTGRGRRIPAAQIGTINAATEAYLQSRTANADGIREARPMNEMEDLFRAIFPRTTRAGTGELYSPALEIIQQVANQLNSDGMRNTRIFIVGHTDSRGADDMNQGLSERRAMAIRNALVMFGVDPARLNPLGRGENDPVYMYDQLAGDANHRISREERRALAADGIRGAALRDEMRGRQTMNRRIEMFLCFPDGEDQVCDQLAAEVDGTSAPAAEPAGANAPVQRDREVRRARRPRSTGNDAQEQGDSGNTAVPPAPPPAGE